MMKIRTLLLLPLMLLGATSCVQDDAPILLGNFKPFDADFCSPLTDDAAALIDGDLDVAGGAGFQAWVNVISQLGVNSQTTAGGEKTDVEAPTQVILDSVVLDYASDPELGLKSVTRPLYFVVTPGSKDNFLRLQLIPDEIADQLRTSVVKDDRVLLKVGVQLRGRQRSGQAVSTNRAVFPIILGNSGVTCAAGESVARLGPCGSVGGQSSPVICCPANDTACLFGLPAGADGG